MKHLTIFLAATIFPLSAAPDGERLFTSNCSACHMPDQMVVGPSLAEIRGIYNGKQDEFVKWSMAPGKKRENVIEMPSMVHVGEDGLRAIYEYVMKVSEGVKAQEQEKGDPYASSPVQSARPQIQRIFMPDASPAAIAVALDDRTSLCWDAGSCRLRYAWTGGFIDGFPYWKGNGSSVAKIHGTIAYVEEEPLVAGAGAAKFLGYSVKGGLPVFKYMIGTTLVEEGYSPVTGGKGFIRSFSFSPQPDTPLVLDFPSDTGVHITSNKGTIEGKRLTIPAADAGSFTVTFALQ